MSWLLPAIVVPLIGLAAYVPLRVQRRMRAALLVKCALSLGFIAYAITAAWRLTQFGVVEPWAARITLFTIGGMVVALLGDVWLDVKDIHEDSLAFYLVCGFISFMICHVLFIVGMERAYSLPAWILLASLGFGLLVAGANWLLERPLGLDFERFRPIVLAYAFVIGVATAIPLLYTIHLARSGEPHTWQPLIFACGMVLFLASDLVLSRIYFHRDPQTRTQPVNYVLNYLLYFGAQYTIALSLYFLPFLGAPPIR